MLNKNNLIKLTVFGFTGILMGMLFTSQSKSVSQATLSYSRESKESIFKEIQIVKQSNDNLKEEIDGLKKELADTDNHENTLKNIREEINKYMIIAGHSKVNGPGVSLTIDSDLAALWLTDTINELNSAGAEVISVNGTRLNNKTIGFDNIPNGQIVMAGDLLKAPYVINAIGNSETLYNSLNQQGGLIKRLQDYKPSIKIDLQKRESLEMAAL